MVTLVLTRDGFEDMLPRLDAARDAMWVDSDVLTASEVADLRRAGFNMTVFTHRVDPERLEGDIGTVKEHHPGQVLWVEAMMG